MICRKCGRRGRPCLCRVCQESHTSQSSSIVCSINTKIRDAQISLEKLLPGSIASTIFLEREFCFIQKRVSRLKRIVESKRRTVNEKRTQLNEILEQLGSRKRRLSPKPEFTISFERYISQPSKFDKTISSLHPFRKLRGVASNLVEERRAVCLRLLGLFQLRQINMRSELSEEDQSMQSTELVADFYAPEEAGDHYSHRILSLTFTASLALWLSQVLDVPLPFPMAFGTSVSSPCLHASPNVFDSGTVPFPRFLHMYKRVLLPLFSEKGTGVVSSYDNATALLFEDLRYLTSMHSRLPMASFPVLTDPLEILNIIYSSPGLGREIHPPLLASSFPSSPSLSASFSPSATFRRSVIEQTVTEGGEWTLLDQL
jgi:hypothetical protein